MFDVLAWFVEDESGATAIEYGLIASLVSVAVIAALGVAGEALRDLFNLVSGVLQP